MLPYKGISYKKVLPEEKWPKIDHFLKALSHVAAEGSNGQKKIDITKFIRAYSDIYEVRR